MLQQEHQWIEIFFSFFKDRYATGCLGEEVAGDALHAVGSAEALDKFGLGAEAHADALDVAGGIEVLGSDFTLGIALASETDAQCAKLIEHHTLTGQQTFLDVLLRSSQHGDDVGLGDGGGELDVLGEVLEGVVTCLHGTTTGVVHADSTGRITAFDNFVMNRHFKNEEMKK